MVLPETQTLPAEASATAARHMLTTARLLHWVVTLGTFLHFSEVRVASVVVFASPYKG